MLFFDSGKPIASCVSESCDRCPVSETLHCHFTLRDLAHFLLIAFPPFLLGGAGIYHMNGWMLILWVFLVVGFFGFVEIRVMCSHCPHYAETGNSLKCWANYGSPKLWKYRPGPMSLMEKTAFFGGFAIVFTYPLIFLAQGNQWFLLIVYAITLIGFFTTLRTFLCSQCMNFACPLNTVHNRIRRLFFEQNPEVAKAWGIDVNSNG
jgi:hypothetical protein